ncbi:ScpA family protein [Thermodesulfovibrio sp. Kuro-1]|uniref:segregation and condensation protein A n=1 Tax=Thermodesulfovibrio sp. Kuro-1 TaxID=2580394 RepID=UPI00114213E0|nr:segregation/condensation protein A [Thermodesulfovibrio sp. Kuro-1]
MLKYLVMIIQVALPVFEGPLDLLLHLIKQNKIDIYDIPIALITKQYLEYLELMKELDLEIASEFLVMAATLIYIKSKMLLPKQEQPEEEEDPRKELVEQLIEYEKIKEASQLLKERYKIWSKAFSRNTSKEQELFLEELSIFDLFQALRKILDKPQPKIYIPKETIKIEEKIEQILNILKFKKSITFQELFSPDCSKLEIIVTFLALLELLRLKFVKAFQKNPFGEILIKLEEENENRNYI